MAAAPHFSFAFDDFLKREFAFDINPDRPECKAFRQGHCPLGAKCSDKHPSAATSSFNNLVCKHWLRGLCKKGEACEFLHEYNLRMMSECNSYTRSQWCPNGDECLYLHVDEESRLEPCPHYIKGFCKLGPRCSKKHVRKPLCQFYLAGFCPYGKACMHGSHPTWPTDLPEPTVRVIRDPAEVERERHLRMEAAEREDERERERDRGPGGRREWRRRGGFRGGRRHVD